ncbi:MAG TPA: hypothetical protein VKH64_07515 [Candidatus Binatia bacterium]|nr:hypothetical protein [Candidatus Binatia bacterium]
MRFLRLDEAPPPGPPERRTAVECTGPGCGQTAVASAKPMALRPAERVGPAAPLVGPRLAALLARDELEKLVAGRVALDVPEGVRAGGTMRIEARLAENLRDDFIKSLKDLGMANPEAIAEASVVKASLSGEGFQVVPPADDVKALSGDAQSWSWEVTPTRSGLQPIVLTLTARVKVPGGGEEEKDFPAVTRQVAVEGGSYAGGIVLAEGWLWVSAIALVLAAVIVWLANRRRAAREHRGFWPG